MREPKSKTKIESSHFVNLLDNIQDVVFIIDYSSFNLEYINPSAGKILGISADSLYTDCKKWMHFIHPDFTDAFREFYQKVESGNSGKIKLRIINAQNEIKWVELTLKLIYSDEIPYQLHGIAKDITSSLKAKASLESSQNRLSMILQNLPNIVLYESGGGREYLSENIYTLLGYHAHELIYPRGNFEHLIHKEDLVEVDKKIRKWHAKKNHSGILKVEFRCKHKAGHDVWIEDYLIKIRPENDKPYMTGILVDITERKKTEKELKEWKSRYDLVVSHSNQIVYDFHSVTDIIYWSGGLEKILGYDIEEMQGGLKQWLKLVKPEYRRNLSKCFKNCVDNGERFSIEYEIKHCKGNYVWVSHLGFISPESTNNSSVLGVIQDVYIRKKIEAELIKNQQLLEERVIERTLNLEKANLTLKDEIVNRKITEHKLKKSEAIYKLLAANIPNSAVSLIDKELKLQYPEGQGLAQVGLQKELLDGKSLNEFLGEADFMFLKPALEKFKSGEASIIQTKFKDRFYLLSFIPLQLEEPEPILGITMMQDVTDMKHTQFELKSRANELVRSNADLEQFAYVASHDLKEPLRMIGSYAQLLEKRYGSKLDEPANEFIQFIIEGVHRVHKLLDDLLKFSRVSQQEKSFESIDFNEVLNEVLQNLQLKIQEKNAKVLVEELPLIKADKSLMIQLFQNIIDNALKFSQGKPHVKISQSKTPEEYLFCVEDEGIGISKDYYDKIFVIFQRLHLRNEYPGTGVGLAICKKIIEHHGGTIWLESEMGKGTKFYFSIPK